MAISLETKDGRREPITSAFVQFRKVMAENIRSGDRKRKREEDKREELRKVVDEANREAVELRWFRVVDVVYEWILCEGI